MDGFHFKLTWTQPYIGVLYATLYVQQKNGYKKPSTVYILANSEPTSLPTGRPLPKVSHILPDAGEREVKLLENWNIKYFA
jgi:hypothetical protein